MTKTDDQKILDLIATKEWVNIELAFEICVGLNGRYNTQVRKALREIPLLCLQKGLELPYVQSLKNIQMLNWENTYLPTEIGQLIALEELYIEGGNLVELPKEMKQLKKLESLHILTNQIEVLPPEIGALSKVNWIRLEENLLQTIPDEIGELTQLLYLDLGYNELIHLPATIGKLENLIELNLAGNQLIGLPAEIAHLQKLQKLNLKENGFLLEDKEHFQRLLPHCKIYH